jgi:hypothetical protein
LFSTPYPVPDSPYKVMMNLGNLIFNRRRVI